MEEDITGVAVVVVSPLLVRRVRRRRLVEGVATVVITVVVGVGGYGWCRQLWKIC